jgi:hypothetical protein
MWSTRGGYVLFRRGRRSIVPHFIWSRDLRVFWSYEPLKSLHSPERWLSLFVFRGRVVHRKVDECP